MRPIDCGIDRLPEVTALRDTCRMLSRGACLLLGVAACGRVAFDPSSVATDPSLGDYELVGQFGEGVFDRVGYSDGVVLASGEVGGVFTSRVFSLPVDATSWSTFHWVPAAPYRKPLPDGAVAETGYQEHAIDMRENVVLLHLDGVGTVDAGSILVDASGRDNDFTVVDAPNPTTSRVYTAGLFGSALDKDQSLYGRRSITLTSDLQFGSTEFTWALWARPTYCSPSNTTFWGNEDTDIAPHIWLGCGPCPGGTEGLAGYYRGEMDGSITIGGCAGTTPIIDGEWHHVAVAKSGTPNGMVSYQFYFDGQVGNQVVGDADADVIWEPPAELDFLAFNIARFPDSLAIGTFDEAAIWRRALSADEIEAAWHRGVLDMGLQIRFCLEADCSDGGPFLGPDNTTNTMFRDDAGVGPPTPRVVDMVTGAARRFAQYRVMFAAERTSVTPRLRAVTWSVE
jgi:hypothetical protein